MFESAQLLDSKGWNWTVFCTDHLCFRVFLPPPVAIGCSSYSASTHQALIGCTVAFVRRLNACFPFLPCFTLLKVFLHVSRTRTHAHREEQWKDWPQLLKRLETASTAGFGRRHLRRARAHNGVVLLRKTVRSVKQQQWDGEDASTVEIQSDNSICSFLFETRAPDAHGAGVARGPRSVSAFVSLCWCRCVYGCLERDRGSLQSSLFLTDSVELHIQEALGQYARWVIFSCWMIYSYFKAS